MKGFQSGIEQLQKIAVNQPQLLWHGANLARNFEIHSSAKRCMPIISESKSGFQSATRETVLRFCNKNVQGMKGTFSKRNG